MQAVTPIFRMVAPGTVFADAPSGWAVDTLRDGEVALLVDGGGLDAVDAAARALDLLAVPVMRHEPAADAQERAVIAYAASLPLVWVAGEFTDQGRAWAHDRGPMTLLVTASGALTEEDRRRIGRFVTLLARQID